MFSTEAKTILMQTGDAISALHQKVPTTGSVCTVGGGGGGGRPDPPDPSSHIHPCCG